jgi:DNA-binding LacI/PurR family transcriptional regulator
MARKRVTHRDVARHAGVSPAVVSYVINGGPRGTSAAARARVLEAIQELAYQPNSLARALRIQRTHTIGFVSCDFSPLDVFVSPYSAGILTGLAAELAARGYYLLVYPLLAGDDAAPLRALLRGGRLDGVVLRLVEDAPRTNAVLEAVSEAGMPCVCVERTGDPRFGFGAITFDDDRGAYDATRYLVSRGHRRIAHVQGDPHYASARARRAGYERALADSGLELESELIQGDSWTPARADASVGRLLALVDPPTAIFAASDSLAFRAVEVLRAAGRRIPDDVAVVGIDDVAVASEMVPPLTTVRIPLAEIGRRAAHRIADLVDAAGEGLAYHETVPLQIIQRSTA